ncbi:MAG: hypothetical protein ABI193_04310, partial [Minicystis sp.]
EPVEWRGDLLLPMRARAPPMKALLWVFGGAAWGAALLVLVSLCVASALAPPDRVRVDSTASSLWDSRTGAWTAGRPLTLGRVRPTAALLDDGAVLIAGGQTDTRTNNVEASRSFEIQRADASDDARGDLLDSAERSTLLALPYGRAVLLGGVNPRAPQRWSAEARRWTLAAPYPRQIWADFACAVQPDGQVLLAYGREADRWDPSSDTWSKLPAFPFRLTAPQVLALADGRMLVVGEGGPDVDTYQYRPASLFLVLEKDATSWQTLATWPGNATTHQLVQLTDGAVLLLREGRGDHQARRWDPATAQLTPIEAPPARLRDSTLTALADGRALHLGVPAATLWSPGDQRWIAITPPAAPLSDHAALRLRDGRVLVVGGDGGMVTKANVESVVRSVVTGLVALALLGFTGAEIRKRRPAWGLVVVGLVSACGGAGLLYAVVSFLRAVARIGG